MRAALAALALSACVTVGEAEVLVPPMYEADATVTWQADGAAREGTFTDYLTEHGGRLRGIGGALFDAKDAAPQVAESLVTDLGNGRRTTMTFELSYESGDAPGFTVRRVVTGPPGARVAAVRVRAAATGGPALFVHCGGSGADIASVGAATLIKTLMHGEGLVFDYPGYGDSEGARTVADLDRALSILAAYLDEEPGPVILWGHSFGGLVCAELADRMASPAGVIVEASAPDVKSAASYFAPWWAAPFVRVTPQLARYDAAGALARAGTPVLVLGAGRDRILSVRASRALADELAEAGVDVTYAEGKDADHFSAFATEAGAAAVRAFLTRLGASDDGTAKQMIRLESTAERSQ